MSHWSQRYIGRPVIPGVFDCAVLAETVQREVFGKTIELPSNRESSDQGPLDKARARSKQIAEGKEAFAERTNSPKDGDAVLLQTRGYQQHIGTLVFHSGEPWVLHTDDRSKQVVLIRARDLPMRGFMIEGYYRWK